MRDGYLMRIVSIEDTSPVERQGVPRVELMTNAIVRFAGHFGETTILMSPSEAHQLRVGDAYTITVTPVGGNPG